jgi:hypothetical protein
MWRPLLIYCADIVVRLSVVIGHFSFCCAFVISICVVVRRGGSSFQYKPGLSPELRESAVLMPVPKSLEFRLYSTTPSNKSYKQ